VELFQAVIDHCHSMELYIDPTIVVCDFEQGVIKALQTVLGPAIAIQGCFYHLTQATWRKIQCEGWNNRFTHLIGYSYPTIWILIEAIQKEGLLLSHPISEDLIGNPPGCAYAHKLSLNILMCVKLYATICMFNEPTR
jgi:hypothetical protein